ncbi:MAG TPA: plastocyanin/azurin family copper-binding protein [Longimicrobiaceae bacterium]|nr:plastocyanin/azurin family copper-binding protein [Longimicrobiaceae bacterium]
MSKRSTILLALTALAAGCGGGGAADPAGPTNPGTTPSVATLAVSPASGSVEVNGTFQLAAFARDAAGNVITHPNLPAPTFATSDATRATVDGTGLVRGLAAGPVTITASLTAGGTTHTALAALQVTAPAGSGGGSGGGTGGSGGGTSAPSSATVQGVDGGFSPNTVTIAVGGTVTWTMVDEDHDITWVGAAPPAGNIERMDEGESVTRSFPTAGTYTYRCDRHDDEDDPETGTVTVVQGGGGTGGGNTGGGNTGGGNTGGGNTGGGGTTGPSVTVTTPGARFSPAAVTIQPGGTVTWQFSGDRHNVTFTGAAPTGGNIPDTSSGSVSRTFPAVGTYGFVCTRHNGMTGQVVVQ